MSIEDHPDSSTRVDLEHDLVWLWAAVLGADEMHAGRVLEQQPQLGLGDWEPLAGADEEGDPSPAPVVDLQPQCGVRLGRGFRGHALDLAVALVLPPHVVGGSGVGDRPEHRELGVLERLGVTTRGGLHGGAGEQLH